jgi:hypothetical protein
MGYIDNERLTMKDYVQRYLPSCTDVRIFTGCVSPWALRLLVSNTPLSTPISVITGSFAPVFQEQLDAWTREDREHGSASDIFASLRSGKLRVGFHHDIHMKVWLMRHSSGRRPWHTIYGSSNLTLTGMFSRKGEQNDRSRSRRRFLLEEQRWRKFEPSATWLNPEAWRRIRNQTLWKGESADRLNVPLVMNSIEEQVALTFQITRETLRADEQSLNGLSPRNIFIFLAHEDGKVPVASIARHLGRETWHIQRVLEEISALVAADGVTRQFINSIKGYLH